MENDESQIELGTKYRDRVTGFEGTAVARHSYLHGCTRITLQAMQDGDLKEYTFDAPSLQALDGKAFTSRRTGGDRPAPARRSGE